MRFAASTWRLSSHSIRVFCFGVVNLKRNSDAVAAPRRARVRGPVRDEAFGREDAALRRDGQARGGGPLRGRALMRKA
jgi:hypothetical protein